MKPAQMLRFHSAAGSRASSFLQYAKFFFGEEAAVTSIEYALIASLIAMVIIAAVGVIGTNLDAVFSTVAADF